MPSDLQVSNIRDLNNANSAISIASDGQVTIAQNNPTIQLGANTTFPSGMIVKTTITNPNYPTGSDVGTDNGYAKENATNSVTHTGYTVGNTLLITITGGKFVGTSGSAGGYVYFGLVIYNSADNSELASGNLQGTRIGANQYTGTSASLQAYYTPSSGVTSIKIGRMAGGDNTNIYGYWRNFGSGFGGTDAIKLRIDEIKT